MEFRGFSPESFEQLIRALAVKIIGPGVTAFGNGPDGGREATFRGRVQYPYPPATIWDGYGVIQAKFKEKMEGVDGERQWVEKQIRTELQAWLKSQKRKPKPDYLIFCTNVSLSSASGGGRDAVNDIIKSHAEKLGLKGFDVWDANQLKTYIDGQEEIRRRFLCFLTGGDLLAEFSKCLQRVPVSDAILTAYLARELLADEDARLSQAGDRSEDRIRLAQVFVDLSISEKPVVDPDFFHEADGSGSLHLLLHTAAHKLDPHSLYENSHEGMDSPNSSRDLFGRFVFIGGPGSGKSTIGQFLAQIHRAALLERRPAYKLEDRLRKIINDIKQRCMEEGASWPSTPRYPFRIELNAFAKALSTEKNGVTTLSEYLRKQLSRDVQMTHEDLREWLSRFPWLLIFDGLDEVPSSSNRREVVAAIQAFLIEARYLEADLMIVASSRPDGYADEFDGDHVLHLYLTPLSISKALVCAQRYLTAKCLSEARLADAMSILERATGNPLIAKLMRSPLQVTFMVTVVAASGKPSESRWQLFSDYYRTIYERELHKAVTPFDRVLNERRQDIDALHHRVGFILQRRAESSGGTQSDLSAAEFEFLVEECLLENGLRKEELDAQKQMIIGAASSRLVFLTSKVPGRLSFDVRSLQEYMAAACLTNGDSGEVITRLDAIVHSFYWRNTLLFAVGRFFVEPQMRPHRDKIRLLCEDLNRKDNDRAKTWLGSRLALEILESGTVGNVPLVTRSLAHCALMLLAVPQCAESNILERLAAIYEPSMDAEFKNEILLRIGQKNITSALPTWLLVHYLARNNVPWAEEIVNHEWSLSGEEKLRVVRAWLQINAEGSGAEGYSTLDANDLVRVAQVIRAIPLKRGLELLELAFPESEGSRATEGGWLGELIRWWDSSPEEAIELRIGSVPTGMSIRVCLLRKKEQVEGLSHLAETHRDDAERGALSTLVDFIQQPSIEAMERMLEYLSTSDICEDWISLLRAIAPWPLACVSALQQSKGGRDALNLRADERWQPDTWHVMENGWIENGITLEELCNSLVSSGPTLCSLVRSLSATRVSREAAVVTANAMLQMLASEKTSDVKDKLAWMFTFYVSVNGVLHYLDPIFMKDHLFAARSVWWSNDLIMDFDQEGVNRDEWLSFFNSYGALPGLKFSDSLWALERAPTELFLDTYSLRQSFRGLLRLAGFWRAAGVEPKARHLPLPLLPLDEDRKDMLAELIVRMTNTSVTLADATEMVRVVHILAAGNAVDEMWSVILHAIEKRGAAEPALGILLNEIAELIPLDEWQLRARAENLRSMLLQSRPSSFTNESLNGFGLPVLS